MCMYEKRKSGISEAEEANFINSLIIMSWSSVERDYKSKGIRLVS